MDKRLLTLFILAAAGALGFWIATTLTSSGDQALDRQFVRPKNPGTAVARVFTVEEIEAFDHFPLYWVGERFDGLALTEIRRYYRPHLFPPEDYVVFFYGECTPLPEMGCREPLQIRVEPYCYKQPQMISSDAKEGSVFKLRGADAQYISGGLRVWTGSVSVKIDAYPTERLASAAQALFTANAIEATAAGATLPQLRTDCSNYTLEPYLGE